MANTLDKVTTFPNLMIPKASFLDTRLPPRPPIPICYPQPHSCFPNVMSLLYSFSSVGPHIGQQKPKRLPWPTTPYNTASTSSESLLATQTLRPTPDLLNLGLREQSPEICFNERSGRWGLTTTDLQDPPSHPRRACSAHLLFFSPLPTSFQLLLQQLWTHQACSKLSSFAHVAIYAPKLFLGYLCSLSLHLLSRSLPWLPHTEGRLACRTLSSLTVSVVVVVVFSNHCIYYSLI